MSDPIQMLLWEHKIILKVVHALSVIDADLEQQRSVDPEMIRKIVEFMQVFADKNHHAKEEDILFPALEAKGVPHTGCPLGGLTGEHVRGRTLVRALADATDDYMRGEAAAVSDLRTAIGGILQLYPNHIWKEDEMVFPMAARFFLAVELDEIQQGFDKVQRELGEKQEQFVEFAGEMEKLHAQ